MGKDGKYFYRAFARRASRAQAVLGTVSQRWFLEKWRGRVHSCGLAAIGGAIQGQVRVTVKTCQFFRIFYTRELATVTKEITSVLGEE